MLNASLKQQFCPILVEIKLTVKKHSILLVKLINNPQLELGSNCLHSIVYSSLLYIVDIWVNVIYQISQTFQIFFLKASSKNKSIFINVCLDCLQTWIRSVWKSNYRFSSVWSLFSFYFAKFFSFNFFSRFHFIVHLFLLLKQYTVVQISNNSISCSIKELLSWNQCSLFD